MCTRVRRCALERLTCASAPLCSGLSCLVRSIRPRRLRVCLRLKQGDRAVKARKKRLGGPVCFSDGVTLHFALSVYRTGCCEICQHARLPALPLLPVPTIPAPRSNKNRVCLRDRKGPALGTVHMTLLCWKSAPEHTAYETAFAVPSQGAPCKLRLETASLQ